MKKLGSKESVSNYQFSFLINKKAPPAKGRALYR